MGRRTECKGSIVLLGKGKSVACGILSGMADATIAPCRDNEVKAMGDEEAKFEVLVRRY